MTAEDEWADGSLQARMNVIHEAGLFQGRLGFSRAIVMLEEGCTEFSNNAGLGQIRFPQGRIAAAFEEVRRVLERDGLVAAQQIAQTHATENEHAHRGRDETTEHDQSAADEQHRSEEHTSELQSLMRISYAVFCLKKKKK